MAVSLPRVEPTSSAAWKILAMLSDQMESMTFGHIIWVLRSSARFQVEAGIDVAEPLGRDERHTRLGEAGGVPAAPQSIVRNETHEAPDMLHAE